MTILDFADLLEKTDKVQCFKTMFQGDKCCALGVAGLALDSEYRQTREEKVWMELAELNVKVKNTVGRSVMWLNDKDKLDFKQIAALIRSV